MSSKPKPRTKPKSKARQKTRLVEVVIGRTVVQSKTIKVRATSHRMAQSLAWSRYVDHGNEWTDWMNNPKSVDFYPQMPEGE